MTSKLTVKIIEFFLFASLNLLALLVSLEMDRLMLVLPYIIIIRLCHMRLFYYLFCLEIVNFEMEAIDKILEGMQNHSNITELISIREYFHGTYEMMDALNEVFGCSMLAVILSCFYVLLADLNWFYTFYDWFSFAYVIGE